MTINLRVLLVLAMAMLVGHGTTLVFAQGAVPAGETGPQAPAGIGQSLNATVSLTAAYDDDLAVEASTHTNYIFGPQVITHSNQFHGSGQYQWRARDVQFRADGSSQWVHDRQTGRVSGLDHTAVANLTARLPRRMVLLFDQTTTYTQSPLYKLFPRVAATDGGPARSDVPDYGANDFETHSYNAQATLEHAITRRSSVSFSATGDRALTVRQRATSELATYGMSTRFIRVLSRNTRANVRYMFRAGRFPYANLPATTAIQLGRGLRLSEETAEIGLTYGRPLSATRRMVFDAVLGGAVVSPLEQPLRGPIRLTDSYRLIGQASASYPFGKTWQAGAMYRRGVDYVPGLTEPVLTDGFSGRLEGSLSRRVAAQASMGYASGASALIHGGAGFDTYTSDVKLSIALGRAVSTYAQYLYYLYDFRGYAPLVPGTPPALERNGLRVGLTLSVPTLEW